MLRRRVLVLVAAATLLAGCGDDDESSEGGSTAAQPSAPAKDIVAQIPGRPSLGEAQARGTYVGVAGGGRGPAVAFVVQGERVVAYVCDGKKRGDWFGGSAAGGRFDLETGHGTRVVATVANDRVTGTLSVAGAPEQRFTAVPPRDRPPAGLYTFDDPTKAGYKARWIVTASAVHGVSSTTTGTTTNGIRVTTSTSTSTSGSNTDSRFSGVSSQTSTLLAQQQALASELNAATSENVSLRNTLQSSQPTSTTKGR